MYDYFMTVPAPTMDELQQAFADSIPDLDCVSIGPEMADVHTPREHLSISSVQRTYELLKEVLKNSR